MKFGLGFSRFWRTVTSRDKDAKMPTRKEYKRITEKAAKRALKDRTFGMKSSWNITVIKHFGTFRPMRPFNH